MTQGTGKPDGFFARADLGSAANALLDHVEYNTVSLDDAGKAAISTTDVVEGLALVIDETNNTQGAFFLQGAGNAAVEFGETGTAYGTTEDNDGTTNIYWDAGNSRYEINNETGGTVSYRVILLRTP